MADPEVPKDGVAQVSWPPDDEKMGNALSLLQELFPGLGVALLVMPFGEGPQDVKLLCNVARESLLRVLEAVLLGL